MEQGSEFQSMAEFRGALRSLQLQNGMVFEVKKSNFRYFHAGCFALKKASANQPQATVEPQKDMLSAYLHGVPSAARGTSRDHDSWGFFVVTESA
jgi:hypothetical protein